LRLAGGAVLCWVGFNALRRGIFFEQETQAQFESIALVPLACPMIAGPATIAACIATSAREGLIIPGIAILAAIAVNHIVMIFSRQISKALGRLNLMGAIIRLTGLVVMTIGIQMVLDGIAAWQGRG
jgi:multiple antibiotic resistance protein